MLLLITTTKNRPAAFEQLKRIVSNQTVESFDWLIVSDGWDGYKFPKGAKIVKRDGSADTLPSLCQNWLAALDWIEQHPQYERFIVLDDDDYYHREYLAEAKKHLEQADLVGWQNDAYYYVLNRKARRFLNTGHASLGATAFTRAVLPYLRQCVQEGDVFIDLLLWKGIRRQTLEPQAPLKMPDGSTIDVPPRTVSHAVAEFKGKRRLVDNFTGIVEGSDVQPEIDNKTGRPKGEHPRHIGCKEPWHGGLPGLSRAGHDYQAAGAWDAMGTIARQWFGDEDAEFYLKFSADYWAAFQPPKPGQGLKQAYPAGVLIGLGTVADD